MSADAETIANLARALKSRETTAENVLDRCLERIAERNGSLNAFITVLEADARRQAREADREIAEGRYRGPLHGVPLSIKDLFDISGSPTTAASRVRRHHVARNDARAIALLRTAGAVFIGKTNLHEFALGTTNEESAFGPARHPADPSRSPGGSSGGSAVSVAAAMCFASIGTDTGGSVRIPSALCGLVGLKPTVGDVSTEGVVPLSTTLDHVGPLCRSVEDAGILFDVLRDAPPRPGLAPQDPRAVKLGVPRGYFLNSLDPQVAASFEHACQKLRDAGMELHDVAIPRAGDVAAIYLHIVLSEGATYHAKTLERQPEDYSPGVRLRLEMGRYVLAEDYARALKGRELLKRDVDEAIRGRNALLLPSLPITAPKIGATTVRIGAADEPIRNVMLRCTQAFNISGHPAITLPCTATTEGLPIGVQLVGTYRDTPGLLQVARTVEYHLGPGISR